MKPVDKFIEQVKNHPVLWDTNAFGYRDVFQKEIAWDTVAKESGLLSTKDAKYQWKRLRDSHREALRRRKISPAVSTIHNKPWKYEKAMEFLVPLMKPDVPSTIVESLNIVEPPSIVEPASVVEPPNIVDTYEIKSEPSAIDGTSNCISESAHLDEVDSFDPEPEQDSFEATFVKQIKPTSVSDVEENIERRRQILRNERHMKRRQILNSRRLHHDALGTLFISLCEKTRALPKHLQLRVQREVFESVTRAEEEALSIDPSFDCPSARSSNTPSSLGFANELRIKKSNSLTDSSSE